MTEISKMFENAGIEPVDYKLEPMGTLKFSVDDIGNIWTREQYMKEVPIYPPFTAEKQLELIKWLAKTRPIHISFLIDKWVIESVVRYGKRHDAFKDALSGYINHIWQSLTDQEKEKIRGILNE